MLQSKKGKGGGYLLARRPEEITWGSVLRVLDGSLAPVGCVGNDGYRPCAECRDPPSCRIRLLMTRSARRHHQHPRFDNAGPADATDEHEAATPGPAALPHLIIHHPNTLSIE